MRRVMMLTVMSDELWVRLLRVGCASHGEDAVREVDVWLLFQSKQADDKDGNLRSGNLHYWTAASSAFLGPPTLLPFLSLPSTLLFGSVATASWQVWLWILPWAVAVWG